MMTMAIEGNVNWARLLLSLYEREQEQQPSDAANQRPSVAMTWDGEPEWTGPPDEEATEAVLSGGKELEIDNGL
jgi:hypothetical protein